MKQPQAIGKKYGAGGEFPGVLKIKYKPQKLDLHISAGTPKSCTAHSDI